MVWAAITFGKPGVAYLFTHGWHSRSDAIVRAYTVYANMQESGNRFQRSSLFHRLDPTEKGSVSYFVGMIAAKVLCSRLLDTPWLMHLSMAQATGYKFVLKGRSQPDFVGYDQRGQWIVAEAKGRSNGFSDDAMIKAKHQTRKLRRINSSYPSIRVAVQAFFGPDLSFAISDPEDYEEDARDVGFDENIAIRRYYSFPSGASKIFGVVKTIRGKAYDITYLNEVGVTIGIRSEIARMLASEIPLSFATIQETLQDRSEESDDYSDVDSDSIVFTDGLLIELDDRWSKRSMVTSPEDRIDGRS